MVAGHPGRESLLHWLACQLRFRTNHLDRSGQSGPSGLLMPPIPYQRRQEERLSGLPARVHRIEDFHGFRASARIVVA